MLVEDTKKETVETEVRFSKLWIVVAFLIASSTTTPPVLQGQAPGPSDGEYIGLEAMPNISPDEKDAKWFHENTLVIRDKQVILDMSPVYFLHGKKWHSASDGGFKTYRGEFFQQNGADFIRVRLFQSDYIAFRVGRKPYEELEVYPVKFTHESVQINGVNYKRTKLDPQREEELLGYFKKEPVTPPARAK